MLRQLTEALRVDARMGVFLDFGELSRAGENPFEGWIIALDGEHGIIEGLADGGLLGFGSNHNPRRPACFPPESPSDSISISCLNSPSIYDEYSTCSGEAPLGWGFGARGPLDRRDHSSSRSPPPQNLSATNSSFITHHSPSSFRIRHERPAATAFKVVEAMNLAGHFQIASVDGVVPAFDVDRAVELVHPQDADDVGPVRVAEAGGAMPDVGLAAPDAELADDVPGERRVLAVDVKDFAASRPLA